MEEVNYLVVAFFVFTTILTAYLGLSYYKHESKALRYFGIGTLMVSLAFLVWTYIVAIQPSSMQAVTTLGVFPLLVSFIFYMSSALTGVKAIYRFPLLLVSTAILLAFILTRFFFYESDPSFTEDGYFAFNVAPVVLYFYALILSFNFIPAVYVVGRHIKHDLFRVFFELGLTLVSVGLVIMVTNTDETLQIANGAGIAIGLLVASGATAYYGLGSKVIKK